MKEQIKMSSRMRHELIIEMLKQSSKPITGSEFAKRANVSRQVIVQDVSILKAKNEPIIATSQGYFYMSQAADKETQRKVVVCKHVPEQTLDELYHIVDHGVTVKDVIVEHPVYGDLTASLRVSNRKEADEFVRRIQDTEAAYLLTLTDGIHLHTLEADSMGKIESACKDLDDAGILFSQ
ncbi:transcription repressor NadR [Virgibacillus xinjiangensis]|uniref:Transcription repressor NadR n=1 Tax=Virgibacillus xinjiangensis TaxID=393090 RepID=A0ABV7CRF9_9BACI